MANQIKDSCDNSNDKQLFISAIGDSLPSFVYRPQEGELVGWNAVQSSIFWLRIATCFFAFLSYAVMSSVSDISYAEQEPKYHLKVLSLDFNKFPQCCVLVSLIVDFRPIALKFRTLRAVSTIGHIKQS